MKRFRNALATLLVLLLLVPAAALAAKPIGGGGGKPGGDTTTWNYTAMGDSLGTGIGALKGYVPRYADHVQADNNVSVSLTNTSQNGWTSADLLKAIKTDRKMINAVKKAYVVTWNIGGNDLRAARDSYKAGTCGKDGDDEYCLKETVATFKSNWDAIVSEIKALRAGQNTIYRTMDIYNPYVNEDDEATRLVLDGYLDQVNLHIANQASTFGYLYAEVYEAFGGGVTDPDDLGYIGLDGLHPNDEGHKKIAELLRALGYSAGP